MLRNKKRLILASRSKARGNMLRAAGLDFESLPAALDEEILLREMLQQNRSPEAIAQTLAREKARQVARENPDALTIGADQILELEGEIFTKACNEKEAAQNLRRLRGKTHRLISAVSVYQGPERLWETTDSARLTMHDFDEAFLQNYLDRAGPSLTRAVGAYELESLGVWLFKEIKGDFFTILGLPLLPLLCFLREEARS